MLITVQGFKNKINNSVDVIATLSAVSAIKLQKTTLVVQLIDNTVKNVENLLIGKSLRAKEIRTNGISLTSLETGIDALLREQISHTLDQKDFESASHQLASTSNTYDVIGVTLKKDFVQDLIDKEENFDAIKQMLESSQEIYDVVFVLLPSKNQELCQKITTMANSNFVCVRQSKAEPLPEGKNIFPIVTDYETTSAFNLKHYKKQWNRKQIFVMPHNVGYKDAAIADSLLLFLSKNVQDDKSDENFYLINNMDYTLKSLLGFTEKEEQALELKGIEAAKKNLTIAPLEITKNDFEERTIKKGFFAKPYTVITPVDNSNLDAHEETLQPPADTSIEEKVDEPVETETEPVQLAEEKKVSQEKDSEKKNIFGFHKNKKNKASAPVKNDEPAVVVAEEKNADTESGKVYAKDAFKRLLDYSLKRGLAPEEAIMKLGLKPTDSKEKLLEAIINAENEEKNEPATIGELLAAMQ